MWICVYLLALLFEIGLDYKIFLAQLYSFIENKNKPQDFDWIKQRVFNFMKLAFDIGISLKHNAANSNWRLKYAFKCFYIPQVSSLGHLFIY